MVLKYIYIYIDRKYQHKNGKNLNNTRSLFLVFQKMMWLLNHHWACNWLLLNFDQLLILKSHLNFGRTQEWHMSDFYNYSKNWEQDLKIIFAFVKMYLRASGLFLYFYLFKYLLKSIYKHIYGLCYFSVQFYSINKISVSVFFRLLRAIFFPNYSFFFYFA